jgi:hypothetical protein
MILIHIALYSFMLSLGFVMGVLFPQIPWVPLWLFSTFAVIGWRSAKLKQQRDLHKVMQAHQFRMEQFVHNNTLGE